MSTVITWHYWKQQCAHGEENLDSAHTVRVSSLCTPVHQFMLSGALQLTVPYSQPCHTADSALQLTVTYLALQDRKARMELERQAMVDQLAMPALPTATAAVRKPQIPAARLTSQAPQVVRTPTL